METQAERAVMDEKERYTEICKPNFDDLRADTQEILRILRGRNGDPGLLDEMRDMKRFRKGFIGVLTFIVVTLFTQAVVWIRSKFG